MNRLPETVNNKFNELYAVIGQAGDDLKMTGAEAAIEGNFSLVSSSMENCQRLLTLEMEIKTCLSNFKSTNHIQPIKKNRHHPNRHTRKSGGRIRVRIADKVIEQATISDTFVETLKVFGLDKVAKLNKRLTSIPLLARQPANSYQSQRHCNGWYITTHFNRQTATKVLEEIGKELHIPLKVESVDR